MTTPKFQVTAVADGDTVRFSIGADGQTPRDYHLEGPDSTDYKRFFEAVAQDYGVRQPGQVEQYAPPPTFDPPWRPLITDNLHPKILVGYGDPAVLRVDDGWVLVATSNDAPDAFPVLHSDDLEHWRHEGFVFAEGETPQWTMSGLRESDFWAPELARVGSEYWLCFTARASDRRLAIGLAKAQSPTGPFTDLGRPLLSGDVIDSHIFVDEDGSPWLLWKRDTNGHWPRPLARLIRARPDLIEKLYESESDRRTAALTGELEPWALSRRPMERWFLMQLLIRATLASWDRVQRTLREYDAPETEGILEAMRTPILAQRMAEDGESLIGDPVQLLVNDQDWEGHLIEGPFVCRTHGKYYLFYAGNDFTSPAYGIGVAVADRLIGPYVKQSAPLLRSTKSWTAPGHASVAPGADGEPRLFFHAYHPDTRGGYNVFRALLTVGLSFDEDGVTLRP